LIKAPVEKPNPVKEPVVQAPKTWIHRVWEFNGGGQRLIEFVYDLEDNLLSSRVVSERDINPAPAALGPTPPAPKQNVNTPN
jgi:hypothetical protein